MKSRKKLLILTFILVIMVLVTVAFLLSCLIKLFKPTEDLVDSTLSPDGKYTVQFYRVSGHATVGFSVKGNVTDNSTGSTKTFFSQYNSSDVSFHWVNNSTISANGILLDLANNDIYDGEVQTTVDSEIGFFEYFISIFEIFIESMRSRFTELYKAVNP